MHQVATPENQRFALDEPFWRNGFGKGQLFGCFKLNVHGNSATAQAGAPRDSKSCTSHSH
ncbi:hypothetical protein [Pseudomonas sp. NPDC089569]|uniref:hypothetical protein n=1 Tax=Pseudomonas sp. NPDC089569 TaxID=3390722 RepID=UPI003CFE85C2